MADKDGAVELAGAGMGVAAPAERAFAVSAVYYVSREGLAAGMEEHVARAAEMGFDSLLAAAPFVAERAEGEPGAEWKVRNFDAVAEDFGGGSAAAWLETAAGAAHDAGLAFLLDVHVGAVAPDATVDWWDARLAAWQAAGVNGFRFLDMTATPAAMWRRLVAGVKTRDPHAVCLAWSVGAAPAVLAGLRGCGFDFAFSSVPWWDFKAGWLNDDAERVSAVAPVMAMPAPPTAQDFGHARALRSLRLAAAPRF